MNKLELRAARQLLGFSVFEAAEWVGEVDEQTWLNWELKGENIPSDVIQRVRAYLKWRKLVIQNIESNYIDIIQLEGSINLALVWYDSLADFMSLPSDACVKPGFWRPHQSCISHLMGVYSCQLVRFDLLSYQAWMRANKVIIDGEVPRAQWAVFVANGDK